MRLGDTIAALSSGSLPAGIAVVRLSGPHVPTLLVDFCGALPQPRRMSYRQIGLGEILDRGLVVYFPGPNSFTGEPCAELHLHGSPAVVRALLRQLSSYSGVRLAEAGEFTRRAFENGRLDLAQAQGLADLVSAETEAQRALALARAEGGLSRRIEGWRSRILDLRAELEAQLDFSDEGDVAELSPDFASSIRSLVEDLEAVIVTERQGRIVRDGFRVVLAGPPNAGKSSLLNALSRSDVAIVSDEPGTTRDLNQVPLDVEGQLVILVDSAGLRNTASNAEAIGVSRARAAMDSADLVLWLVPPDAVLPVPQHPALLRIGTKSDLTKRLDVDLSVSSLTGSGIKELMDILAERSGARSSQAANLLISQHHDREALRAAATELRAAFSSLHAHELAAENLRLASTALERLLGRVDAEHVLDQLFSQFCIGK